MLGCVHDGTGINYARTALSRGSFVGEGERSAVCPPGAVWTRLTFGIKQNLDPGFLSCRRKPVSDDGPRGFYGEVGI